MRESLVLDFREDKDVSVKIRMWALFFYSENPRDSNVTTVLKFEYKVILRKQLCDFAL